MNTLLATILLALALTFYVKADGQSGSTTLSCGQVDVSLAPCVSFLAGRETKPADACCAGVRRVKDMAVTSADKQAACECVKAAATSFADLKDEFASQLPAQCGVPLPFPITRNIDSDLSRNQMKKKTYILNHITGTSDSRVF